MTTAILKFIGGRN